MGNENNSIVKPKWGAMLPVKAVSVSQPEWILNIVTAEQSFSWSNRRARHATIEFVNAEDTLIGGPFFVFWV